MGKQEVNTMQKNHPVTMLFFFVFGIVTVSRMPAQNPTITPDNFSTLYGQFSRSVQENISSDSTRGEFYYLGGSNMFIEVHEPIHQIMTFTKKAMTLYYPESKKAFRFKSSNPMILPLVPGLKTAIRADYGLIEMGFKLADQEMHGDTLISYWFHPKMRENLGAFKIVEVNDRLAYTEYEIPSLSIRNITTFSDHLDVSGMIFPTTIVSDISNAESFVIEKVKLWDLQANLTIPDHILTFSIPKDVDIVEKKW
jgi:hypothetical protein